MLVSATGRTRNADKIYIRTDRRTSKAHTRHAQLHTRIARTGRSFKNRGFQGAENLCMLSESGIACLPVGQMLECMNLPKCNSLLHGIEFNFVWPLLPLENDSEHIQIVLVLLRIPLYQFTCVENVEKVLCGLHIACARKFDRTGNEYSKKYADALSIWTSTCMQMYTNTHRVDRCP